MWYTINFLQPMDPCLINILERGRRKRKLIFKRKSKSRISVYESIDFCNTICRKKKIFVDSLSSHSNSLIFIMSKLCTIMKSTIPLNLPRQYRNIFELLLHDLIESRRSCNRNLIEELFYIHTRFTYLKHVPLFPWNFYRYRSCYAHTYAWTRRYIHDG